MESEERMDILDRIRQKMVKRGGTLITQGDSKCMNSPTALDAYIGRKKSGKKRFQKVTAGGK